MQKTIGATLIAAATLAATAALAENVSLEQRAKLEALWGRTATPAISAETTPQASSTRGDRTPTFETRSLTGPERALQNFRSTQTHPAG